LSTAKAVFYAIDKLDIDDTNHDEIVSNYLVACKMFLNDMWLVKDHCADLMLGFIEYPHVEAGLELILPYIPITTHSNFVTSGFTDSSGNHHKTVQFTKAELQRAKKFQDLDNRTRLPFSETSIKPTLLEKGMPRVTLGSILTLTARTQNDLGLKISHYCSALESLFTTDNMELSHKLSERVAYFLASTPNKRRELYRQTKNIYAVRSKVVHGSAISKVGNLSTISKQADTILRRVFLNLYRKPALDKYFRKNDTEGLEKYMTYMILGIKKKKSA